MFIRILEYTNVIDKDSMAFCDYCNERKGGNRNKLDLSARIHES